MQLELIRTWALVFPSAVKKSPENIKRVISKKLANYNIFFIHVHWNLYYVSILLLLCVEVHLKLKKEAKLVILPKYH